MRSFAGWTVPGHYRSGAVSIVPAQPAPVQRWFLNEATGSTFAESSQHPNTLTGSNVTFTTVSGVPYQVPTFNGSTSKILGSNSTYTSFDGTKPFSVSVWVTIGVLGTMQAWVGSLDMSQTGVIPGWELGKQVASDEISVILVNNNGTGNEIINIYTPALTINTLYHFVMTYDGSKRSAGAKLYLNGAAQTGSIGADGLTGSIVNAVPVQMGMRSNGTSNAHNGTLTDVRIYPFVLTSTEVANLFTEGAK